RLARKRVALAWPGALVAAGRVLLYAVGKPAEAVDPQKVAADQIDRLSGLTRQRALSLLAGSLNPTAALEALAEQLGLQAGALHQALFGSGDTPLGLPVQPALDQLADLGRGKFPVEMADLIASQYVPRLARLLDDLADERTTPIEALAQAAAVAGLLDQLERAGSLDPEGGHTQALARSLRAYIEKITPVVTTQEHRQLLGLLDKAAADLETTPIGSGS